MVIDQDGCVFRYICNCLVDDGSNMVPMVIAKLTEGVV